MAETRNIFIKSKMNKDLDERLLPQGEYRDARNVSVNKSEGPDEGVVENIVGNEQYSNLNFGDGVEIIGTYVDTDKDRIYLFATNFSDSSPDQLSLFPQQTTSPSGRPFEGAVCLIAYIDGPSNSSNFIPASQILVKGDFLNFSKTHPITGVSLIEDLLFWTDNRNQPRKINVETAIANPATATPSTATPYYTTEDHISVAKFAPYEPISFLYEDTGVVKSSMINQQEEYLPANAISVCGTPAVSGNFVSQALQNPNISANPDVYRFLNLNFPELGYFFLTNIVSPALTSLEFEYPIGSGNNAADSMAAANAAAIVYRGATAVPFSPDDVLQFEKQNPDYTAGFLGDVNYLKDKFIRFSYRYKYDDNEYSLMAPFTQHAFIPKQFGYFLDSAFGTSGNAGPLKRDEKATGESGVVNFMENQVTTIRMTLPLPLNINANQKLRQTQLKDSLKVETIQILAKESDGLAIKIIDEIEVDSNTFNDPSATSYEHFYYSNKPFKVLSEKESTRVHDKVPVKALAQEVASNRVIYGNFVEKHGSPENLDFDINVDQKGVINADINKEYPNHTLKQNRSYKVGVVLVDRYGRSSNVILRNNNFGGTAGATSSVYAPYEQISSILNWPGNNLTLLFQNIIPENKTENYPGLYSLTNPTGYFSYKVVVQQEEQEYYNVYLPGACSGKITFTGKLGSGTAGDKPTYERANAVTNIVLYGDNINKVPKELADVGPTEELYGSTTLLYPRVVTKYLTSITNYPTSYKPQQSFSESSMVDGLHEFTVSSIISFDDLGTWTGQGNNNNMTNSSYPNDGTNYIDPLYLDASSNPFVAQLETDFLIGNAPAVQEASPPAFSKALNVFETNPFKSKIEIYWESSTSGNIVGGTAPGTEGLNSLIINGTAGLPTKTSIGTSLAWNENLSPSATAWVSNTFEALDDSGSAIADAQVALDSVTFLDGTPYSHPFELVQQTGSPNYTYRLRVPTGYPPYYGADSSLRTFNLTFKLSKTIGGNEIVNYSTSQINLSNTTPSGTFNTPGYGVTEWGWDTDVDGPAAGNGSINSPNVFSNGGTFLKFNQYSDLVNGASDPSLQSEELEWVIPAGPDMGLGNVYDGAGTYGTINAINNAAIEWESNTPIISLKGKSDGISNLQYWLQNSGPTVWSFFKLSFWIQDASGLAGSKRQQYNAWFRLP